MAMMHNVSKFRVLVVDDDADTVQSTAMLFEIDGFKTQTALSGPEALQRGSDFLPHLVLLDIAMPEMDGYAVARSMRQTDWGKHAVLIAVTGYSTPVIEDRCAKSGFDHYLRKPVNYAEFTVAMSQTSQTFFELKRDFAMPKRQRAMELTTFIRLELETAWRFLDTSTLMQDPVDKERNRGNARKAYDEADKWFNKDIGMTVEDQSEIAADLGRLKAELFPSTLSCPTDCPFTAVSLKESLLAFGVPLTTPAVSYSSTSL
jgi:CheY-like chemotaxis protein